LLIHRHKNTSNPKKKKKQKEKSAAAGSACGREGGKGEPKSAPYGGLKRKSPPLFPLAPGHGNDGKPAGFTTFPHPSAHPQFPSDFLLFKKKPSFFL
jgi:hypothetical protein